MMEAPLLIEMSPPSAGALGAGSVCCASHYVIGEENRLLLAVVRRLLPAWTPPSEYAHIEANIGERGFNPLVLVGPAGVGKSTLVELAVAQRRQAKLGAKLESTSAWGRAYCEALLADRLAAWRRELDGYELVVLEDLDRGRLSDNAQREMIHFLDDALERNVQIVVTAQREPGQWSGLATGLRDRLASGLTIPLRYPGLDARRKLLELLAEKRRVTLAAADFKRIVEHSAGSPRELMGQLAALEIGWSEAVDADSPRTKSTSSHAGSSSRSHPFCGSPQSLKQLIAAASRYFNVTPSALVGASRRKSLAYARGVAIHVIRLVTECSYARIGAALGGRDHTTILHADRRIAQLKESDPSTALAVEELRPLLGNFNDK